MPGLPEHRVQSSIVRDHPDTDQFFPRLNDVQRFRSHEDLPITFPQQASQNRRSVHAPQHSLGGLSDSSDDTAVGGPTAFNMDGYPEVFQDLEKTRSFTSITALTPNRAKFRQKGLGVEEEEEEEEEGGEDLSDRGQQQQQQQQDVLADDPHSSAARPKLSIRSRLQHFTWAWFTLTMSTGGISLLIAAQPHSFPGLREIGFAVYIINIVLFTLICSAILARFFLYPGTFKSSLTHKREGFFFPTFFLSIATLITSTQRYTIPDPPGRAPESILWAIQVAFWFYLIVSTVVAVGQYSYVFASHRMGLNTMMPTWILPIFPIMLSGTIASVIAGTQPAWEAVSIITAGLTCQGLGLAVATMMYAHMVGRLFQSGLPHREHRPGLFMCVGPPSFTALAVLGLARSLPATFDVDGDGFLDTSMIRTMAIISAGFLWALSFWWFGIAAVAVASSPPKDFHLGWWATVFPNVGFALATISLGREFRNETVLWFATAMSICLLVTYLFVLYSHVRAVLVQDIMYPGRDEDVDDH